MKTLLDAEQIKTTIDALAEQITSDLSSESDIAVIGIRSRGEILAQRLYERLSKSISGEILHGTLDITLYRDDLNQPKDTQPTVRTTEIGFDVDDKLILLVDDVLNTGRSVRAAMDALTDLGRPRMMRLAVLVDRGGREYPIRADYVGIQDLIDASESVCVHFVETDNEDQVIVE